jgi:ribosomal protein S18 acetylase RimI-like enzyme
MARAGERLLGQAQDSTVRTVPIPHVTDVSNERHHRPDALAVRVAEAAELDSLATVWYDAWQDAHAAIVPAELARFRTWESFRDRLEKALPSVRVVGPAGAPVGFYMLKDDELYQLFVSASARGSGVAATLITHAETRLAALGVETAWLACAIGNDRAARFYEKRGWRRVGTMVNRLDTPEGEYLLEVWRYEKVLTPPLR